MSIDSEVLNMVRIKARYERACLILLILILIRLYLRPLIVLLVSEFHLLSTVLVKLLFLRLLIYLLHIACLTDYGMALLPRHVRYNLN
jgi:hypothetical protein